MDDDALSTIRRALPRLTSSELRIAQAILDDAAHVAELAITDLARRCATSVSTVARFAQSLGYSGYREFRSAVARSVTLAEVQHDRYGFESTTIDPEDPVSTVAAKIGVQQVDAIERTTRMLDAGAVESAAGALVGARRVEILGQGASSLTAMDLEQKLIRIGVAASHHPDPHLALTVASLSTADDVVVAFSHTGRTRETITTTETARDAGAFTIAVTDEADSPLASVVDLTLLTHASESPFRMAAMSSRIAQLTVVDILFVAAVQRMGGSSIAASLHLTHDAVLKGRQDGI
ncbi:MurR/RpiR family transcriptional regulator [Streptomyces sp. AC495_CC817]|uniref:MurR/RpiR family transcriptional regulator n=1 Tax=Streptomyces sp. AC495_CC817 TaxID=2823900 RepID=UPI001C2601AE|nr:MurR/RpiR family transcriptional regulator [Streptomyces sp. AC495_CC817]